MRAEWELRILELGDRAALYLADEAFGNGAWLDLRYLPQRHRRCKDSWPPRR